MHDVDASLAFWVCSRLIAHKYRHLHVEVSGATVQGEGARGRARCKSRLPSFLPAQPLPRSCCALIAVLGGGIVRST